MASRALEIGAAGLAVYVAASQGFLGHQLKSLAASLGAGIGGTLGPLLPGGAPCSVTPEALAKSLGVSVYRVRTAMTVTGKTPCTLHLADLTGIPEVPSMILVNGVPSYPNANGPPATYADPAGGSGTWGGLTNAQIQAAFLAANGGDPNLAAAAWARQHALEVATNGF